jgi:nitrite reductase (NO-forming)
MKRKSVLIKIFSGLVILLFVSACAGSGSAANPAGSSATVSFTLKTGFADSRMVFTGVGGAIDGVVDPTLQVKQGDTVQITLVDGDGAQHDISFPDFNATSEMVNGQGAKVSVSFQADKSGEFAYFCTLPGHRQAGMEGKLVVSGGPAAGANSTSNTDNTGSMNPAGNAGNMDNMENMGNAPADEAALSIGRDPSDLPGPIGNRAPQLVRVDLEAQEVTGKLADGVTYPYWTFNGKVPGPFLRVRVGDTVEVHLKNPASSTMSHSVDFHAVTGPGGGAVMTVTPPGGETSFTFKALKPGLFVYHCATPMVAEHIANGMYGMILVEPEGGLPPVEHEFYVMQGEIYSQQPYGQKGQLTFSEQKLMDETPEYFVFNGATTSLTTDHPLQAKVGDTIRIFFGVGGPNFISSFHIIGEIMDRVYNLGSLTTPPLTDVQTTLVPPGGAAMIELQLQVPGRYILVDHAIVRMQRGLMGYLIVDGPPDPEIYQGTPQPGSGH